MQKTQKTHKQYICESCTFISSNKKDYNKHLTTAKHINTTNTTINTTTNTQQYICSCGKTYNYRASLYNHKKKCTYVDNMNNDIIDDNTTDIEQITDTTLVVELVRQNKEFKQLLLDQTKQLMELASKSHVVNKT